ncbi:MAG: NAD(P)H-dependent oxidoreductase [Bacteriovoracaceae bacterium]|nr:NAD(P)H-dependent oxidoreductase [Bacteriovoracaceae bacterium]
MSISKMMSWRYATKKFDSKKKLSNEEIFELTEALRLSPSSFGLQAWKFLVITDPAIREELKKHSWNQTQITDASHLIVLCTYNNVSAHDVDLYIRDMAKTRGVEESSLKGFRDNLVGFAAKMDQAGQHAWLKNQAYIALGSLMTAAAMMKIDTCPIEGFSSAEYDKVLNLKDQNLKSVVVCAVGHRDESDKYSPAKKIRFSRDQVIKFI